MKTTRHIQTLSILVAAFFLFQIMLQATSCAVIVAPTGGPKDSLPPVLVSALPKDSLKNFNEKKIVFEFNEFVDVKEVQKNLIVSPYPKTPPTVEAKLRTVTVRIKDTLEPNTTYTLDFGNAIQDVNESNALKNFTYIFSTGTTFDHQTISGKVLVAETGNVDSTLTVFLYKNRGDSAIVKERPSYIAKLDTLGQFTFKNLPVDTFALYVWKDEGARRYFGGKQLFGFADAYIITSANNAPTTLYAFLEPDEIKKTPGAPKPVADEKEQNKDDKRLKFTTSFSNGKQDILSDVTIAFDSPLKSYDTTKFIFTDGDYALITDYAFKIDSTNKEFTLQHAWLTDTPYHIILLKDFAQDSTNKHITRNDTLSFRTMKKEEYGNLRLRFSNLDLTRNPVLALIQGEKIKFSEPLTSTQFRKKLFLPGEYMIRIFYDENKNGKWDPGAFFGKHKQPEKAQTIPKKLNVKAGWDSDMDVNL